VSQTVFIDQFPKSGSDFGLIFCANLVLVSSGIWVWCWL